MQVCVSVGFVVVGVVHLFWSVQVLVCVPVEVQAFQFAHCQFEVQADVICVVVIVVVVLVVIVVLIIFMVFIQFISFAVGSVMNNLLSGMGKYTLR